MPGLHILDLTVDPVPDSALLDQENLIEVMVMGMGGHLLGQRLAAQVKVLVRREEAV
jgi:hypothetical protein